MPRYVDVESLGIGRANSEVFEIGYMQTDGKRRLILSLLHRLPMYRK